MTPPSLLRSLLITEKSYTYTPTTHKYPNSDPLLDSYWISIMAKLLERRPVSIDQMTELSRGLFTSDDIKSRENEIIEALGWKLNPVVPYDYLHQLLRVVRGMKGGEFFAPSGFTSLTRLTIHLVEISTCAPSFKGLPPSLVAVSAMSFSLAHVVLGTPLPASMRNNLNKIIFSIFGFGLDSDDVLECNQLFLEIFTSDAVNPLYERDVQNRCATPLEGVRESVRERMGKKRVVSPTMVADFDGKKKKF
ncbi:hypothetical protein TrST_g10896 [Triparma strigata]|uniref:Uncharacterized protein n=1 Tax=Triparma strigata TaxID=1606541 RepID=A0A9W7DVR4_9STRA|nr:hypothetical protein TrST_g10896 [Triparma strigata]